MIVINTEDLGDESSVYKRYLLFFYKNGVHMALSELRRKDGPCKEDKAEKPCLVKLNC